MSSVPFSLEFAMGIDREEDGGVTMNHYKVVPKFDTFQDLDNTFFHCR